jgi:N-acetyl-D-muramate 6-phosphate phosphatase
MSAEPAPRPRLHAVLFDLDGTVLDTAPDMTGALNRLRGEQGLSALPPASLRAFVSHGSARLVREGFPGISDTEFAPLQRRFLEIYFEHLHAGTTLFPNMHETLNELQTRGVPVGIVTNKPGWLTTPLLARLGMEQRFACVVSGDTLPQRKPHPAPLLHAAALAKAQAPLCVYVGDAERDIQAARAAGMTSLIARYGYIGAHDDPQTWQADGELSDPSELLPWLEAHAHL